MRLVTASAGGRDASGRMVPAGTVWHAWDDRGRPPRFIAVSQAVPSPSFHAMSPQGLIFTASEDSGEGRVTLNAIEGAGESRLTGGQGAVHLAIDATGQFLAVANYRAEPRGGDLSVAVFPFDPDGRLGAMTGSARHAGHGPDRVRQASPHTHCVMFSPDNRLLAAVDLGTDSVWLYRFDAATGAVTPLREVLLPAGSGPRHCAFHPVRPFLYVCGELDSTLIALQYDAASGADALIGVVSATATPHHGRNYPSGLAISPDGRHLMLGNRGSDTVATFTLDPATGAATLIDEVSCGGRFPRAIRLDRRGTTLAVANQHSGDVTLFDRDRASGRLSPAENGKVALAAPLDVLLLDQ
jgi:6-phosphogluconolactonase